MVHIKMPIQSNVILIRLDSRNKQRRFVSPLARCVVEDNRENIVTRLKQLRRHSLDNIDSLSEKFLKQISERDFGEVFVAPHASDAVDYIKQVMKQEKTLAINKAGTLGELRSCLENSGFHLISTYLAGYHRTEGADKVLNNYWQLPDVSVESGYHSFSLQRVHSIDKRKDYTALLGASAAAAEDGTICFLEHTSNISTMLQEARRLIFLISIEKVVGTREEAIFQTRCMGAFGFESIILNLELPDQRQETEELENVQWVNSLAEVHIIILDNGRREIAKSKEFTELLICISCQACAKHCPTHRYFDSNYGSYPKGYLWSFLIGPNRSLGLCTGCGMCLQQCPLDIDIPRMVSLARNNTLVGWYTQIVNRILQDAWLIIQGAHSFATLTNVVLKINLVRILLQKFLGLQRDAWIPDVHKHTFIQWVRNRER